VELGVGRFGPYVRHAGVYASVPKGTFVLDVTLDQALELLRNKASRNKPLRVLGEDPEAGGSIEVRDGRYGPYVKRGKLNASLSKDMNPESITLEQAVELLRAREAAKGGGRAKGGTGKAKGGKGKKGTGAKGKGTGAKGKRGGAKGSGSRSNGKPKATPADLAPFLGELEPRTAEVVRRLEGMEGTASQDREAVASALGVSAADVATLHKRGMFKLRMAFGKQRREQEQRGGA
jgi:DNA topoisomerase-1